MKRIVCALDPGSGSSSPTGFAAIDPDSRTILFTTDIRSSKRDQGKRLYDLHFQTAELLNSVDPEVELFVFVESFFIRGRGNQILQQVIGALKAAVPERALLKDVANTTVKKVVGGHGQADKAGVAKGVYMWTEENPAAQEQVRQLIQAAEWDQLDALAIAIAGWRIENA